MKTKLLLMSGLMSGLMAWQVGARASDANQDFNVFAVAPWNPPKSTVEQELALAPLLDLRGGGEAAGAAQGSGETAGVLINGTQLPAAGEGFKSNASATTRWGAGIMISLLVNSAKVIAADFPGTVLHIGGIAQERGGAYVPHKSHQNGLDADLQFVGQKTYESVLDKNGSVTPKFDHQRNWQYWRLITSQQISVNGKVVPAVSMILVDPRLKTHLCQWAKANEASLDELDMEVLRKLRPTAGHDDHFHIRIHCSPHYASCLDQGLRSGGPTGCEG